jgi:hypothetical protein
MLQCGAHIILDVLSAILHTSLALTFIYCGHECIVITLIWRDYWNQELWIYFFLEL